MFFCVVVVVAFFLLRSFSSSFSCCLFETPSIVTKFSYSYRINCHGHKIIRNHYTKSPSTTTKINIGHRRREKEKKMLNSMYKQMKYLNLCRAHSKLYSINDTRIQYEMIAIEMIMLTKEIYELYTICWLFFFLFFFCYFTV